ncbi:hypothetical protein HDU98_009629 [Podochytrium sp. JEL0797]|nr:hypothetical protein HDU98_009629 [Podochytrium sp. JEL0797]
MYFGQTILQFATASQRRVEIMKYLVENAFDPADLTAVDFHGNNVMHTLAFHGDIDIELYNYLRARNLSDIKEGTTEIDIHMARNLKTRMTPFQMGISRGHQSIIETMKVIRWEFGPNRQYSVDIQDIDPLQPDLDASNDGKSKTWKRSSASALELAVKINNKAVITNRVFESILRWKWDLYARKKFMLRFFFTGLSIASFMVALALQPVSMRERRDYFGDELAGVGANVVRLTMEICAIGGSILILRQKYFLYCACVAALPVVRFAFVSANSDTILDVENVLFGLGAILGCLHLMSFSKGFERVGPLVVIFRRIIFEDFVQWLYLFVSITAGFSAALFLQMREVPLKDWDSFLGSTLWTVRFIFAQAAFDDFREARLPGYTELLFLVYGFVVIVLLVNVLIAQLVETFKEVDRDSKREWKVQLASLILDIDLSLSDKELRSNPATSSSTNATNPTTPPTRKLSKLLSRATNMAKMDELRVELSGDIDMRQIGVKDEDGKVADEYWQRWNGKEISGKQRLGLFALYAIENEAGKVTFGKE